MESYQTQELTISQKSKMTDIYFYLLKVSYQNRDFSISEVVACKTIVEFFFNSKWRIQDGEQLLLYMKRCISNPEIRYFRDYKMSHFFHSNW